VGPLTLTIGAASRPLPGETANGDGWRVDWVGSTCRIAVIDGLGHGPEAALATSVALAELERYPDLAPVPALHRCHEALRGTRGAVISIAAIDCNQPQLIYAGVGNVEARLWHPEQEQRPTAYRGIVGSALRTLRPFDYSLGDGWLLFMYSDGIHDRFQVADLLATYGRQPQALADALLAQSARQTDDATILVIGASD